MAKGLTQTSATIAIGFEAIEALPNTFTQEQIDLNLSPLDREVFVVQAINLDPFTPDCVATVDTRVSSSLTSTSQVAVANLSNSNCMAAAGNLIKQDAGAGVDGAAFTTGFFESPSGTGLEYIGIIATNDFFVQVEGTGNLSPKRLQGKVYGYRARASADIYAALVQSEVLSA